MQTFMYVEINAFALVVLLLIFFNVYHRAEKYLTEQKLFVALICTTAAILVLDTAMWALDGEPGLFIKGIYLLVTAAYYSLNPLICMLWSYYAIYQVYRNERCFKRLFVPMLIPVCINALLSLLSMFNNWLFYIDNNNVYHRGPLFLIMFSISYLYLICTLILIISKQHKIKKHHLIPILAFAFPPFIGGIIQTMFFGVSIIWVCVTVSILIVFINIQNDQLYTDHLTGLFNRRQLDYYMQQLDQNDEDKSCLAGIMIDVDSFKSINDLYGHSAGDIALEQVAKILKKTFRKSDFIARYGGDEFVVIMEIKDKADMNLAINRLRENIKQFNARKVTPYSVSLSLGYDYLDSKPQMAAQEFIKHIDSLMYTDKMKRCI